jgi:hypothetical protein
MADTSTAETGELGVLLGVELVDSKTAIDFLQETVGFEGEQSSGCNT